MGRTRQGSSITSPKKKPMSSTERSKKRRLDPVKRATDNFKRKNARQLKAKNNPLSTDELEKKREADRLRKAASRLNQSSQKKVGIKVEGPKSKSSGRC